MGYSESMVQTGPAGDVLDERLIRQLRFTREIINAIPTPVFYKDRNGRYIGCNRAFELFYGLRQHELLNCTVGGQNPMEPREMHERMERECLAEGRSRSYEAKLCNHEGEVREVIITTAPFGVDSGKAAGVVGTFIDITDRKQNEQIIQQMQRQVIQQEKMASIGQLAAGVAHEINNPMGFISSNLSTLSKYADRLNEYLAALQNAVHEHSSEEVSAETSRLRQKLKVDYIVSDFKELILQSLEGAGRVRQIVQDLKSFSRVDQAERARTNLNNALETTINIAWNELKYVAAVERKFGDIPDIMCYPQQLNQVFLNLLVNAAHALRQSGTVTVSTWCDENNVYVAVADTGTGIPPAIRGRIFEPFFTTKEVGKGTGLGLSISADIIHKHGGEISVESSEGVGTTFTVRLPVTQPEKL